MTITKYIPFIYVDSDLALNVGLHEAIILRAMERCLTEVEVDQKFKSAKETRNGKLTDGRYWVDITYENLNDWFPFWSLTTIKRKINQLEEKGILISMYLGEGKLKSTKWYSIDWEKV